ncbi:MULTISPECIES: outer membrane beta-barrel protein [unclassified Bradyrhizobium]|uniref:outer membrane beta-barrel protein n=1 Tax=unclassified Bradyrhizobium TaxID=2631580 RepID=UPI0024E0F0FE|nr:MULTISPECIES: outer membrane beta-barrel protein [unclassified Bradyrhizobium]
MGWRPDSGRAGRAMWRGASAICLLLGAGPAQSQTIDVFRPVRDGFLAPQESPLRRTAVSGLSDAVTNPGVPSTPAPAGSASRTNRVPLPGVPAASGAADVGYDSLNRTRKKPKYYPAQARPRPAPGPGTPSSGDLAGQLRPTLPPSASANRQPVPAAMAGTVPGQPARRRLRIDDDPFGAVGDYVGPFLVKGAVELSAGYDSNPARLANARGMPAWMIAPEFLAVSNWDRHAVVADLRGSFTGYGSTLPAIMDGGINSAPTTLDRPDFTGHVDGRLDVTRDTSVGAQLRLRAATDNPGSPSVQAGLARYPIYTTLGTTIGVDQRFNRLQISAGATADRTSYQESKLTDGTMTSNDDRNYNQFGGIGRVSYEVTPGLKPFAEVQGNTRNYDQQFDRSGYQRDSAGGYAKAGTSFEFTRLLTGELSLGYATRSYTDPRLNRLQGFLTSASLVWSATPLTTARFFSDTQVAETTVAGASGVLVRTYTVQVDHDFRRWLTGIGKFTFGTLDYQGYGRNDRTYSAEGNLVYKMTRSLWVKGTLRYDKLDSNIAGAGSSGTVVMLGVRLQN